MRVRILMVGAVVAALFSPQNAARAQGIVVGCGSANESAVQAAQQKPTEAKLPGALGVQWGETYDGALKILEAKGDKPIVGASRKYISLLGGQMGGYATASVNYFFGDGGLYAVNVTFARVSDGRVKTMYTDLRDILVKKYGKFSKGNDDFDEPYVRGDGYELQALRAGKGYINSTWEFDKGAHRMFVFIDDQLDIILGYRDVKPAEVERDKDLSNRAKDF